MKPNKALFTSLIAVVASLTLAACDVTVTTPDIASADLDIMNDIVWDEGGADLAAVHLGSSVSDALNQPSLGSLSAGSTMMALDLDALSTWVVVAVDTDGLWYATSTFYVLSGTTTELTLVADDFDADLTASQTGGTVTDGVGSLVVTNDLDWAGIIPDFATTYIANADWETNVGGPGTEQGFSVQDIPAGDYSVTVTDALDVQYVIDPVTIWAGDETLLSVMVTYATSGAINLTNEIDNLDGDEVFVVGMYATDPGGQLVDLATEYNWLEGVEVGYESTAMAIGIPGGTYQMVIADWDDNYYVLYDILVDNGAITDATVTAQDRDEDLTLALN